jgi:stalled ribosome alternative rescue factor ArfA
LNEGVTGKFFQNSPLKACPRESGDKRGKGSYERERLYVRRC